MEDIGKCKYILAEDIFSSLYLNRSKVFVIDPNQQKLKIIGNKIKFFLCPKSILDKNFV